MDVILENRNGVLYINDVAITNIGSGGSSNTIQDIVKYKKIIKNDVVIASDEIGFVLNELVIDDTGSLTIEDGGEFYILEI